MRHVLPFVVLVAALGMTGCDDGECVDMDGDGYGDGPGCEARDCDDGDARHYSDCLSCSDPDDDGRGAGCNLGSDCAPSDQLHWADCGQCTDGDLDGRGATCDLGEDCDDNDPDQWSGTCASCKDTDGDAHFDGCDAYVNRPGPDCNDADPDNYLRCDYCADGDGDGRFANCDRYNANAGPDCDDADPNNWTSCDLCEDRDGDTYAANCDAYTGGLKGPDCNDSSALHWADCGQCTDTDGDGRGPGCDLGADCNNSNNDVWMSCGSCADGDSDGRWAGCDSYFNRPGPDCNDADGNSWSSCTTCVDADGDGEWIACDTYTTQKPGPDCNDQDVNNWNLCASCRDLDTDMRYANCDAYTTIAGPDCSDSNRNVWTSCATCLDGDGDGRFAGCDAYATVQQDCDDADPRHWADCGICVDADDDGRGNGCDLGPDCDDLSDTHWSDCTTCFDVDSDNWGVGTCDVQGGDCDDNNPARNPGAADTTVNGIDEDCNGLDGPGFFDNFDDGVFAPQWTLATGDVNVQTTYRVSGTHAANLGGFTGDIQSTPFSTSSCTAVAWRVFVKRGPEVPDSGENLYLEYWTGSTWVVASTWFGQSITDPSFVVREGTITAAAALHPQFRVRFRTTGGSTGIDDYFIDDVAVGCDADTDGDLTKDPFDCAPSDAAHWSDCGMCTDGDGDDYGTGCNLGADCDDVDAAINPGATDASTDGIDQNCDGHDGPVFTQTYSNTTAIAITDGFTSAFSCGAAGATTSAIVVPTTGTVFDVDVNLNIAHSIGNHLDIWLQYSDGVNPARCVELSTDNGSGANFTNTVLSDEASTFIFSGTSPFTGTFRPEGLLSGLDGAALAGTYTLFVTDDTSGFTGTLTSWALTIRYY